MIQQTLGRLAWLDCSTTSRRKVLETWTGAVDPGERPCQLDAQVLGVKIEPVDEEERSPIVAQIL
jgi:hypothetical protein